MKDKELNLDIAILGGGFAGVYCAKALAKCLPRNERVKVGLISEENHMVFQPLLAEVAGASISPRHVVSPLRLLCRKDWVIKGRVGSIDWKDRSLSLDIGAFSGRLDVHYKHLVLALGAVVDLSRIPGMPEHAYLMRNVGDAMLLRTTIIGRVEEASLETHAEIKRRLLTFVVVGGGYSGVETAGQILDLFRSIRNYYPTISEKEIQVFLVHSQNHLLPTLSQRLGDYSARQLERRGLRLMLNQRVKAVTASRVYLQDGSVIETNTVISTVGNGPHPFIIGLARENNFATENGRLITLPTCQIKGQTDLWAVGDCAAVPYNASDYCPSTAQFALRQGALVAANLARSMRNAPLKPFSYRGMGELASIGHHSAVADIFGFRFSGFFAWWLWRSIYLFKLPRIDRKIRVLVEWTLDLFFPRDINLLSPRFSKLLKEIHLEKGDILFRNNDPAFSLYIVKRGAVALMDADGLLTMIGAGEYFGERALLSDGTWHFDAQAMESTDLVSIPKNIFDQIAGGSGSLKQIFRSSAVKFQSREMVEALARKVSHHTGALSVAELMQREIHTLRPDMSAREAVETLKQHPHSSYPVVDSEGHVLGVLDRSDVYAFIKGEGTDLETPIRDMQLRMLPVIREDVSVYQVIELLVRRGANKVLIAGEDGLLKGILSTLDIFAADARFEAGGKQAVA